MNKEVNDSSYWREFEKNPLSHSMAHYLMAIDALRNELGYARSTDIAEMLTRNLGWNALLPPDAVKVTVNNGWVTLEGEMEWKYQRAEAEKALAEGQQFTHRLLTERHTPRATPVRRTAPSVQTTARPASDGACRRRRIWRIAQRLPARG